MVSIKRANRMSDPNRRCIFCGHDGKLTSEHIWGAWVTDYVPRTTNKHTYANILVPRPGEAEPPIERIRAGDPLSSQVPVVCGACNSGWLSQLQNRAKPFLAPLFKGEECVLEPAARTAIAAWVTMASMTSEYVARDPTKIAISQAERDFLMHNRFPPKGWRIWIGRHRVQQWVGQWIHATFPFSSAAMNIPNLDHEPNTQTTAIQIGELYIFVLSSIFPAIAEVWDWSNAPRAHRCLRQLWPHGNNALCWPGLDMTDDVADMFARAFYRENDRVAQQHGYS